MTSASSQPGSNPSVQGPYLPTQNVHVSSSTCHDLSVFKGRSISNACNISLEVTAQRLVSCLHLPDILKEYRRLDDTIVMRLNRAGANMRDKDRIQGHSGTASVQDQACESIWRELVGESPACHRFYDTHNSTPANWKRRTQLVEFCVSVVDQSITDNRNAMESESLDPASQRKIQGDIFAEEVKVCLNARVTPLGLLNFSAQRKQVHRELTVEEIVRKRSADGTSSCGICVTTNLYFYPFFKLSDRVVAISRHQ